MAMIKVVKSCLVCVLVNKLSKYRIISILAKGKGAWYIEFVDLIQLIFFKWFVLIAYFAYSITKFKHNSSFYAYRTFTTHERI